MLWVNSQYGLNHLYAYNFTLVNALILFAFLTVAYLLLPGSYVTKNIIAHTRKSNKLPVICKIRLKR